MQSGTKFLSRLAAAWIAVAAHVTAKAEPAYLPPPPEYFAQKTINDRNMAAMKGLIDETLRLRLRDEIKKRFIFLIAKELNVALGILPYRQMKQAEYILAVRPDLPLPAFTYKTEALDEAAKAYPEFVRRGRSVAHKFAPHFHISPPMADGHSALIAPTPAH